MKVIPGDENYYSLCALLTVAMQLSFFAVATTFKFDLVTDFAGSSNFILLAVLTLILSGNGSTRALVLTVMVIISRAYLACFLLFRVCTRKSDARFDETRDDFCKFLGFWFFQMMWAFFVSMPVIYVNSRADVNPPLGAFDYIGWILSFSGIVIQVVADMQKHGFRKDPANRGQFCRVGLWSYSRHPNYFGEILVWTGAFVCTLPVIKGNSDQIAAGMATVLSPIFTVLILVFLSGMPTSEGIYLERFYNNGQGEAWEEYAKVTAPIVLMPNSLYRALPDQVKLLCCCELPFLRYPGDSSSSKMEKSEKPQMGPEGAPSLELEIDEVSFGEGGASSSMEVPSSGIV